MIMPQRKYGKLLENPDVRRWYSNVARGSRVTADVYLRRVGGFCKEKGLTPADLAGKDERELRDLLMDFVSSMEEKSARQYWLILILQFHSPSRSSLIQLDRLVLSVPFHNLLFICFFDGPSDRSICGLLVSSFWTISYFSLAGGNGL